MLSFNKQVFDKFSIDRLNHVVRNINHDQSGNAISVLIDKHVKVYDEQLFNNEVQNFRNSNKILGILKSNISGTLLKGFFRVPNLSANIIFLNQGNDFKFPPVIEPNLFYNENQISLLIRKYVEENFSEKDVFLIGQHEGRVPISIFHEGKLINHFPTLGLYTNPNENFLLSQKQIKKDIDRVEHGALEYQNVYSTARQILKRVSGGELKKNYEKKL